MIYGDLIKKNNTKSYINEIDSNIDYDLEEIEEAVYGVKINKKKLNDTEYVKSIINKINAKIDEEKGKNGNKMIDMIKIIFAAILAVSIIGIPVLLLIISISNKLNDLKYNFKIKDLKKIDSYIEKTITKLNKSKEKAKEEDKSKYDEAIKKLEYNRKLIKEKLKIDTNDKENVYAPIKVLDNKSDEKIFYESMHNFKKYLDSNYKGNRINIEVDESSQTIQFLTKSSYNDTEDEYKKDDQDILSILQKVYSYKCLSKNGYGIDHMFNIIIEYKGLIIEIHSKFDKYRLIFTTLYSKNMEKDTIYKYKDIKKLFSINNLHIIQFVSSKYQFEIDVHSNELEFCKSKINNIFKDYDITIKESTNNFTNTISLTIEFDTVNNESYYNEDELHDNNLLKEENTMSMTILANLAKDAGLENLSIESDIIKEYEQVIDSLDTISESKIAGDISVLPVYESDKSYYTDLETLYTVSEVYDVELDEAMKLLKEVNDLSEDTNISIALKEGFENYTTLEEFVELKEALNEAGIDLAWNKELSDEDFITEAGKISDFMDKVKDKIKNMRADSLEKSIKKCEESNKKLNEELEKVQKMSKEEADKYAKKQSAKNIAIISATSVSAGVVGGATLASNMLIGIPVYAGVITGAHKLGTKVRLAGKGLVGFNSTTYKKAIKNTIKINNKTIKQCNTALKSKK